MSFHEKEVFYRDRVFEKRYREITPEIEKHIQLFASSWALKEPEPKAALAKVLNALELDRRIE